MLKKYAYLANMLDQAGQFVQAQQIDNHIRAVAHGWKMEEILDDRPMIPAHLVKKEIDRHTSPDPDPELDISWPKFLKEMGVHEHYDALKVLEWLGY